MQSRANVNIAVTEVRILLDAMRHALKVINHDLNGAQKAYTFVAVF